MKSAIAAEDCSTTTKRVQDGVEVTLSGLSTEISIYGYKTFPTMTFSHIHNAIEASRLGLCASKHWQYDRKPFALPTIKQFKLNIKVNERS